MKKTLLIFLIFTSIGCFSQAITVNTNTYTVDQLINKVLINSPCVSGNNVKSKTGSLYGSVNGIGYFENTNSNFPFTRGVVLTTGDINKVPSPNNSILSDGNSLWTGDADLEANMLLQSGISMKSINASYIEFDFQPKTPNFDFSFLFASEEYGTAQCNFSDAFAFLLKDVTTGAPSVNLAVIPNTNIPVSVETIRDGFYNAGCPSANLPYFGAFNGDGFGPAINFNGQTVKMTASASGLNTSHIYRIKLVIADGGNNTDYDSAIFLEANSFNIGQNVLGLDYSAENNKAICLGSTLPTLSAAGLKSGTTFEWKKDGIAFSPAQTGVNLNLNTIAPLITSGKHVYSVTYTEIGCTAITDKIIVEIYPTIGVLETVPDIYTCENESDLYNFDLNKNTAIIMAGTKLAAGTTISYHISKSDAEGNLAALSNLYSISKAENGKTIYVRIKSATTPCYEIRSFQLKIVSAPEIKGIPTPVSLCARNFKDSPLKAVFNLSAQKALILGSQSTEYNIMTFHSSQDGANNNTKLILVDPKGELISPTQTIWVRLQNISNVECYSTTSFQLNVVPIPRVDVFQNVVVCEYYILPKLSVEGSHYWTGPNGTGIQLFAGDKITKTTTIFIYNNSGICANQSSFMVIIVNLDDVTPASVSYCSEYKLPTLLYGQYYTLAGGKHTPGNREIAPGTTINTVGLNKFYVWFEDLSGTPSCSQEKPFAITIIPFVPLPKYEDQFECNAYTLPEDLNGGIYYTGPNKELPIIPAGTVISTTTPIYVYKETKTSPTNCTSEKMFTVHIGISNIPAPANVNPCSTYILPALKVGEYRTAPAGGGSLIATGTSINATTTIWFHVPEQSCTDNLKFTITIKIEPLPEMPDIEPQCDIYYLPSVAHSGNYYSGPSGTGKMYAVGSPITATQKMYFYDKAPASTCFVEKAFQINIIPSALLDAKPVEVLKCGVPYILDDLKNGEYYEFAGGPSPTNPVLRPGHVLSSSKTIYAYAPAIAPISCESEYSIAVSVTLVNPIPDQYACNSYELPAIVGLGDYYTAENGPYGTGVKLSPPYAPITSTTKLYVYAENYNRVQCSDEKNFTITIYNTPVIAPINPVTACESFTLPTFIAPASRYFTNPGGPSATNKELFPNDLIKATSTIYAYAEVGSSSTVICNDEEPIQITILPKPKPELTIPPICVNKTTNVVSNSDIYSGYDASKYSFEWRKEDGTLVGTSSDFSTNVAGNYTFQVTDLAISEGCPSDILPFNVTYSSNPEQVKFTTSGWFSNDQQIVITAVPYPGYASNFTYSIDGNEPQTSNIFTNVISGTHEITVNDANGCGSSTSIPIKIKLVNSPKFFTPNGDGFNDKWKITELEDQPDSKIFIFDRYGKLLKEIFTNGEGWDGLFIGQPLPADDYWFTISYVESGVSKEYKSHFSLYR